MKFPQAYKKIDNNLKAEIEHFIPANVTNFHGYKDKAMVISYGQCDRLVDLFEKREL